MGLKINGSTSGSIEIDVPAVAGTDTSITIPAKNGGTFIVEESTGNIDLGPLDINGSASDDLVNINADGRLLIGTTTARSRFFNASGETPTVQIESSGVGTRGLHHLSLTSNSTSSNEGAGAFAVFGRSRGGVGDYTVVSSGDAIGSLSFQGADGTDLVEAARITALVDTTPGANDMPGRLVFMTTLNGASTPTTRFRIDNNGSQYMYNEGTNTVLNLHSGASAGTSTPLLTGLNGATSETTGNVSLRIWTNGDIQNSNGSYTSLSDAKLKENIADASSQWDDLKAVRVRNWNFKEETGLETHRQIGPVAQELEQVCPNLVYDVADLDEEGNDLGTTTKSVRQSVLYMKAVKALQEAMERIETLETANASLEARLTALEGGAS